MARVHVSDATWSAFRAGLGATPVSVELGRLVEPEVARRRRLVASDAGSARQAIDDARVVVRELSEMIERLEHAQRRPEVPISAPQRRHVLFDVTDA
jgi:hypothetical protein